ncbi:GL11925 [Drosophila persimilis]|uniref:GL11925 n=1 Tax=Drosophila persimilis TaxID=7234 RepID=B4HCA3_DROPE|nr:GL11925 [Drosophila persimilis]
MAILVGYGAAVRGQGYVYSLCTVPVAESGVVTQLHTKRFVDRMYSNSDFPQEFFVTQDNVVSLLRRLTDKCRDILRGAFVRIVAFHDNGYLAYLLIVV